MSERNLRKQNEAFMKKIKEENPHYFDELKKGQEPEYFVLACSDSRVSPSVITEMPLGNLFVHRNIANQVVSGDESFSASLYYALNYLKVKKIIIKGHTDCGGIKAAWSDETDEELQGWISGVRQYVPEKKNHNDSIDYLAKINVINQVERLKKHPVYKAYGEDVEVRGCLFHVESGELERLI